MVGNEGGDVGADLGEFLVLGGDRLLQLGDGGAEARLVAVVSAAFLDALVELVLQGRFLTMDQILRRLPAPLEVPAFERHLAHLRRDFVIEVESRKSGDAYKLGAFRAFVGQDDHLRHEAFLKPTRIS